MLLGALGVDQLLHLNLWRPSTLGRNLENTIKHPETTEKALKRLKIWVKLTSLLLQPGNVHSCPIPGAQCPPFASPQAHKDLFVGQPLWVISDHPASK